MKRYDILVDRHYDGVEELEDAEGKHVRFEDVQALAKEMLRFVDPHSNYYDEMQALRDKLKAIIEAKP